MGGCVPQEVATRPRNPSLYTLGRSGLVTPVAASLQQGWLFGTARVASSFARGPWLYDPAYVLNRKAWGPPLLLQNEVLYFVASIKRDEAPLDQELAHLDQLPCHLGDRRCLEEAPRREVYLVKR